VQSQRKDEKEKSLMRLRYMYLMLKNQTFFDRKYSQQNLRNQTLILKNNVKPLFMKAENARYRHASPQKEY